MARRFRLAQSALRHLGIDTAALPHIEMTHNKLNDLLLAIDRGDIAEVTRIAASGVSVNDSTSRGCTPLMFAVMPNELEDYTGPASIARMVDHLLGLGADAHRRDDFGMTAYDYASQQLDPTWKGRFGGSAALRWNAAEIEVLEKIKDKLKVR